MPHLDLLLPEMSSFIFVARRFSPEAAFLFKVLEREESADDKDDEEDR